MPRVIEYYGKCLLLSFIFWITELTLNDWTLGKIPSTFKVASMSPKRSHVTFSVNKGTLWFNKLLHSLIPYGDHFKSLGQFQTLKTWTKERSRRIVNQTIFSPFSKPVQLHNWFSKPRRNAIMQLSSENFCNLKINLRKLTYIQVDIS